MGIAWGGSSGASTGGTPAPEDDDEGFNPTVSGPFGIPISWDTIKNAAGEVQDMATGMGALLGSGYHDLGVVTKKAAPFVDAPEEGFLTDDIAKQAVGYNTPGNPGWHPTDSPIAKDYTDRYEELFKGDIRGFLEEEQEHPLSFALDALTVASVGGSAASKAGKVAMAVSPKTATGVRALRAAEVAGVGEAEIAAVTRTAKLAAKGDDLAKANLASRTARAALPEAGAAEQAAARLADVNTLASIVHRIRGSVRRVWDPVTNRMEFVDPIANPTRRLIQENTYAKLVEAKPSRYSHLADKYTAAYQKAGGANGGEKALQYLDKAQKYRKAYEGAIDAGAGSVKRFTGVSSAARRGRKLVDWAVGYRSAASQNTVQAVEEAAREVVDGLPDEDVADIVKHELGLANRLTNDGINAMPNSGIRRAENFQGSMKTPGEPGRWNNGITPDSTAEEVQAAVAKMRTAHTETALKHGQAVRNAVGNQARVVLGDAKDAKGIQRSAELLDDTVDGVEDASRGRVMAEDMYSNPAKAQNLIDRVAKAMGGTVKHVDRDAFSPDADGSRYIRAVIEVDGHPMEWQFTTPEAARILDGTTNLRRITASLAVLAKRGVLVGNGALTFEKAKRLSQHLWEGVTDDMRHGLGGEAPAAVRARLNRFRVTKWAETADAELERGLSIDSAFDNAFLAQRRRSGAVRDMDRGGFKGGNSPLELDDALAQAGEMAPSYTPMMDAEMLPHRTRGLDRKGWQEHGIPKDRNLQQNTGELLDTQRYSEDFEQIWAVRARQAARVREKMDLLMDIVGHNGRVMENAQDYNPRAEEVFAPGLVKRLMDRHNDLLDELAEDPTGRSLVELLKRTQVKDAEMLEELANSGGDIPMYAVPKFIADRLRDHGAKAGMLGDNVDLFIGTPTRIWKTSVLSFRPAMMVNNLLGNVAFSGIHGVKLRDVVRQLDPKYRQRMKDFIGEERLEGGVEGGLYSGSKQIATRTWDDNATAGAFANKVGRGISDNPVGRGVKRFSEWSQRMNSGMEDAFRRAGYLSEAEKVAERAGIDNFKRSFWKSKNRLEAAARVGVDQRLWRQTVNGVDRMFNDYRTMSPLGRNIVRPYVSPFMSFYKHAAKTVLTMPYEHPMKAQLLRILAEWEEERINDAGYEDVPAWMKGSSLMLGPGTEAGDYRFMSTAGLNPFNAVVEPKFAMNLLHPMWKLLYENQSGRSSFTGRQFTDPNVKLGGAFSDQQYRIDPETGESKPVDKVVPGLFEHLMQQVPQYEMVKDLIAGGSTYDTSNLLSVIRNREDELPTDPETGEPYNKKDALEFLTKMMGYSEYDTNLQEFNERQLDEKQAALDAWLESNESTPNTGSTGGGVSLGG